MRPAHRALLGLPLGRYIGDKRVGQAGDGIYSGYTLSDGDNFTSLDLVSAANPSGAYFTTRGYSPAGGARAPTTGPLAVMHDVSPDYTGWADQARGVPLGYDSHSIVAGESSALRLKTIRQTAPEQTNLVTGVGGQIERAAMIHTGGRLWINGPAIVEWRAAIPAGPAGQHPTLWLISAEPLPAATGSEYGFEGNSTKQQAYQITWTGGATANSGETLDIGTTYRDGAFHTFTVKLTATQYLYYVDGTLVNTINIDPDTAGGNKSEYILITNHVYNATFLGEAYSAAAWAGAASGVNMDVEWMRVWRQSTAAHYQPLTSVADTNITNGGSATITLPSQSALWGATGLTEYVEAIQNEVEEPGGSNSTSWAQFPTGVTYNSGTRQISIAAGLAGKAGCLHFVCGVSGDGITCKPLRFRLNVAPIFTGSTSSAFTNGVAVSMDIYSMWDVGRLFQSGSNPKGLTVSGLPAGLSFSSATGLITGTPTADSTGSITTTATNSAGQTTNQAITWSVTSGSAGVVAPTITGSPTLLSSWDFDKAASISSTGGLIDSITGADGTSNTLSGTGATRPTLTSRAGKGVASFTGSHILQLAGSGGLGAAGQCTMVVIAETTSAATTQSILDVSNGEDPFGLNRYVVVLSSASGYTFRRLDTSGNISVATQGSATAAKHLWVGRAPSGTSAVKMNIDGVGTAVTAGVSSAAPIFAGGVKTTLGADISSSVVTRPLTGWVWRVLIYSTALSDAQVEEIAVWAATNYGTTNNA